MSEANPPTNPPNIEVNRNRNAVWPSGKMCATLLANSVVDDASMIHAFTNQSKAIARKPARKFAFERKR